MWKDKMLAVANLVLGRFVMVCCVMLCTCIVVRWRETPSSMAEAMWGCSPEANILLWLISPISIALRCCNRRRASNLCSDSPSLKALYTLWPICNPTFWLRKRSLSPQSCWSALCLGCSRWVVLPMCSHRRVFKDLKGWDRMSFSLKFSPCFWA